MNRHFTGDPEEAMSWLRVRAYETQAETFAEREMQRRIDKGEKVVCEEIPVYSTEDEGPQF